MTDEKTQMGKIKFNLIMKGHPEYPVDVVDNTIKETLAHIKEEVRKKIDIFWMRHKISGYKCKEIVIDPFITANEDQWLSFKKEVLALLAEVGK